MIYLLKYRIYKYKTSFSLFEKFSFPLFKLQIQRLQQTISSKANECTELSQKLSLTLPKLTECERFGSELQQWFQLIAPENTSSEVQTHSLLQFLLNSIFLFLVNSRWYDIDCHIEINAFRKS